MCGIAGIFNWQNRQEYTNFLPYKVGLHRGIAVRGPDGFGEFSNHEVYLCHTRLAIIDLVSGAQPLYGQHGEVLIANGEIYNYPELKSQFAEYSYTTHSDCEVLIPLWHKYGCDMLQYIRGMISFALYIPNQGLILGRDAMGIKPLYYHCHQGQIAFASTADSLIYSGFAPKEIDDDKIAEWLEYQYIAGHETIWRGIHKLPRGTIRHYDINGNCHEKTHDILGKKNHGGDFHQLWHQSLTRHIRADVNWGLFLSGGLDSSVILAGLHEIGVKPEFCLTTDFQGGNHESQIAKKLCQKFAIKHETIQFGNQEFDEFFELIPKIFDDPIGDYAVLPTLNMARLAQKHVKVILSGEGGDEVFGGYGRYRTSAIKDWWRKLKNPKPAQNFDFLSPSTSKIMQKQAIDFGGYLPDNLLLKLDRSLMQYGIEGRVPFCDDDLANFGYYSDDNAKIRGHLGKIILRDYAKGFMDTTQAKQGFTVPIYLWLQPWFLQYIHEITDHSMLAPHCARLGITKQTIINAKNAPLIYRIILLHRFIIIH